MIGLGRSFRDTEVYKDLMRSAEHPFDMTAKDALIGNQRLQKFVSSGRYFDLYYATQRVDKDVIDGLQKLADELELVRQFRAMKQGAICNRIEGFDSENRMALHTACRDLFQESPVMPEATTAARGELKKLETLLNELDSAELVNEEGEPFEDFIHIGIGGSDLGPRCLYEALRPLARKERRVHFISNVDPDDAARVLRGLHLKKSLVNIVSKSGTTLETLANEKLVRAALREAGCDPAKHCIAVTGEASPMDNPQRYLRSFYIWDWVGGRFSSTSMVGCVMLGFALGFSGVMEILEGAAAVDCEAEEEDIRKNVPLLMALLGVWNHNFLDYPTLAILPYSQALHRFAAHIQQLDMESNGKSVRRNGMPVDTKSGPIIWGEPGTNGQHAFYQLIHQGTEIVPVEFIGFRQSQIGRDIKVDGTSSQQKLMANLLAQQIALATGKVDVNPNRNFQGNRPCSMLLGEQLDCATMGALLATYEARTVYQGFLYDINSFDQEGVQLGKVLAGRFLAAMQEKFANNGFEKEYLDLILSNV